MGSPIRLVLGASMLTLIPFAAMAQEGGSRWQRSAPTPEPETRIFHCTWAVNLPTAAMIEGGTYQFEIAHRFVTRFSDGADAFYGLDGPANIRLALAYGLSDRTTLTIGRTNYRDQVDVQLKQTLFRLQNASVPVQAAFHGGIAWTTDNAEFPGRDDTDGRSFQYYAQGIINALLGEKLAVGVVPSYLYNSILESDEVEHALTVGFYAQYYATKVMSLVAEWNITEAGYYYKHDAAAFGIELETGGHFFKIIATNSVAMNVAQYVIGTRSAFDPDEWRLGFQVTRLLHF